MIRLEAMEQGISRRIRSRRELRMRRPPRLRAVAAVGERSIPAVYYLCPDLNVPTGGIRVIYRHVDALNSMGISATVVHKHDGFICSWFDHNTSAMGAQSVRLTPADVLVVPEFYGLYLHELPAEPHLVVFNQNAYQTFAGTHAKISGTPYRDIDRLEAMLVVSHDNAEYVRYAFPGLRVERIRNAIDSRIFHPAMSPRERRIAVMPRRRNADCRQVLALLAAHGCLDSWEIVNIDGRPENEAARALQSCSVFLSFSELEGFGMPPAEAMACGCYVVGFTGFAGREFFDPSTSTPVEEGNILAFAKAVERTLLHFDEDGNAMRQRALKASANVLEEYSIENQRADLQTFFGSFPSLRKCGRKDSAGAVVK
jgi:glycosyltransferase involved in cell wall biosynthesis